MNKLKILSKGFAVLAIATLAIATTSSSCKRCTDPCDPECKNYDPCCGQAPANASFKIYEILQSNPSIKYNGFEPEDVATDTIIFINVARFYADFEADYYEWRIDGDNRVWNTREFFLGFGNLPYYTPAEVTLKVYRAFDKNCFPKGQDTAVFKRSLYTVPKDSTKMFGYYNGYLQSKPNETNHFSVKPGKNIFGDLQDTISGIFPYCSITTFQGLSVARGYRSFYMTTQSTTAGCCYGMSAFGIISKHEELKMTFGHYTYNPNDSCYWTVLNNAPYLKDVFYGIKEK